MFLLMVLLPVIFQYSLHGVPQGNALGPLPFLICINNLPTAILHSVVYLFDDDTKMVKLTSYMILIDMSLCTLEFVIYKLLQEQSAEYKFIFVCT